MSDGITIYQEEGTGQWLEQRASLLDLNIERLEKSLIIFAKPESLRLQYSHFFPEAFAPVICTDINGSFFCDDVLDDNDNLIKHANWAVSWSCFKIKFVDNPRIYNWVQPAIFMIWFPDTLKHVIFIIDHPLSPGELLPLLPTQRATRNPYTWHAAFAGTMMGQYDKSFWGLRNIVRDTEKARDNPNDLDPGFFPNLHDIARHVFHSNETLEIAEHTLQSLVKEQCRCRELYSSVSKGDWLHNERLLLFRAKQLHSLKTRSRSLAERLHNEINLGFNLVSQRFGSDAKSDNAMMKTVAIVSMVYLPGTFVSGLFGTNFFDYSDGKEVMTDSFWIYWAITIPLTLLTMLIWACWHYYPKKKPTPGKKRMDTFPVKP
ncbi:uncharacterized protein BO80DRAFT_470985 [Aspergillus ibericus CBS 121593]|uniref:Uncharacterized protein n=1 Tax=Aspergillus ibericus CBS 121593 TaxID=1448316 RepID=A0A395H5R9_9EURO|nr:hypothetical protein BO80DRAFT_470985 [Aspergillus ibericus CBS 121593]RAL03231.1 hypothetical protein BO80DRAFT_470985 [Aspergillus ibericus CBS 121593]